MDLTDPSATEVVAAATADVEVGTVFYCAGADPNYAAFLSQPIEDAVAMIQRNCVAPIRLCHHFAGPMRDRGRGSIVLVSSGAGLVGGPNMVTYGATKAFDMVMMEALWAEMNGTGVDVLGLVLGLTDTPALRRLLLQRGQLEHADDPIAGAAHSRAGCRRGARQPLERPDLLCRRRRPAGRGDLPSDVTERGGPDADDGRRRSDG